MNREKVLTHILGLPPTTTESTIKVKDNKLIIKYKYVTSWEGKTKILTGSKEVNLDFTDEEVYSLCDLLGS